MNKKISFPAKNPNYRTYDHLNLNLPRHHIGAFIRRAKAMKSTIKTISLLTVFYLCVSSWSEMFAADKPNIIFLMADDQNFDSIGCYGNPEVITPNMDKLGRDGVIFDRHYNTTSVCMASRANVMTGMYEYKAAANFSHGDM